MLDMLVELCRAWPQRWNEYISPILWTKHTLPGTSLPFNTSRLSFSRNSFRRQNRAEIDAFVEQNTHERRDWRWTKTQVGQAAARASSNFIISRPSVVAVSVKEGDLVMVRKSWRSTHRGVDAGHYNTTSLWDLGG